LNIEFKRRQEQVLEVLRILSQVAKQKRKILVFLGGSAIQTAVLSSPKRLSVDLDVYYDGNIEGLMAALRNSHTIEQRHSSQEDLFSFYSIFKGAIQVKLDVTKFGLAQSGKPYEKRQIKTANGTFEANVATAQYLIASKFSSIAIGTVGRRNGSAIDFLKDVFDCSLLIDEFGIRQQAWQFFVQIGEIQNRIRKTDFSMEQITASALSQLRLSASVEDERANIRKADLGNFNQYLLEGQLKKAGYWTMAYHLSACLSSFKKYGEEKAAEAISKIEKDAGRYADSAFVATCEAQLANAGIDAKELHTLKIMAPKALTYLHAAYFG